MEFGRWIVLASLLACGRLGFDEKQLPDGDATPLVTCESRTPLPVPTTGRVTGTIAPGVGDQGSCDGGDTTEDMYALDVLVPGSRIQIASDDPSQPASPSLYIRSVCDDPTTELECDQTDGITDSPQITRAVAPGRYFVFVDGKVGRPTGAYNATLTVLLPAGAACDPTNARDRCDASLECIAGTCRPATCDVAMAFTGPGPHDLTISTSGQPNRHAGTCGDANDGGLRAPERVLTLTLTAPSAKITVDTAFGNTDHDTLVYIRDACQGVELACDDDGGGNLKAIATTGPVPSGTYFLFIDGFSDRKGNVELRITAD